MEQQQIPGISYKADGTRVYPTEFKRSVIAECNAGISPAELARKYQIPMQNIVKWLRLVKKVKEPAIQKTVNADVHEEAVAEIKRLQAEVKKLSKSLANMTVDRDILKDAVDYASKKKWI